MAPHKSKSTTDRNMNDFKATPECWEWQEKWASKEVPDEDSSCFLELRARVEALEAQGRNYPETPDSSTPPPVATDEELDKIWNFEDTWNGSLRALYNLGVAHGQARSRKVAEPANVTRDRDEAGNYLIIHDTPTPPPEPPTSQIIFNAPPTEEIIRLSKEGFYYKGQFIADAGEAHRLMLVFLKQHAKVEQEPPTDEELRGIGDRAYDFRWRWRNVAEPAPVAGEMAELVADLRRMASQAYAACQFNDGETLTRAANTLPQLSEQEAGR